jgi:hypothetical protein
VKAHAQNEKQKELLDNKYDNKKILLLLFSIFNTVTPAILTKDNQPTPELAKLLKVEKIESNSLEKLVTKTQSKWLRNAGTERWEQIERTDINKDKYVELFKDIGLVDEVKPQKKEYDYVLVLGATAKVMQSRFAHVIRLCKDLKFKTIIFLTGQRDVTPTIDLVDNIFDPKYYHSASFDKSCLPTTETGIAEAIIKNAKLPVNLKDNVKIEIIDTPKQQTTSGELRRPNFTDTFKEWLKTKPARGSCLVISNNPYIDYTETVAKTILPKQFSVEVVGTKAHKDERIATYLDSLARWIYQCKGL